jgi:hypothetical protein
MADVVWIAVCGLDGCRQGGPCAARELADLLVPVRDVETAPHGRAPDLPTTLTATYAMAANLWILNADVCEMPAGQRRELAARLLDEHWPESCGTDATGQARALAELLEVVDAVLDRPWPLA